MSKSGEKNGREPKEKAQHGVGGGIVLLYFERGGEKGVNKSACERTFKV